MVIERQHGRTTIYDQRTGDRIGVLDRRGLILDNDDDEDGDD
jgi:hypothetical protein